MSSVRDRSNSNAIRKSSATEIADIQKEIDSGTQAETHFVGDGFVIGSLGRTENAPSDARGRAAHRARREFVEETELRPAAEALAKVIAKDNARVVASHEGLLALLTSGQNLDAMWAAQGHSGSHPLLNEFTRGQNEASSVAVDHFYRRGGAFDGFLQSEAFKPHRNSGVQNEVLSTLLEWMGLNYIDITDPRSWQKAYLIFSSCAGALPEVAAQKVEPTAAERIQYTVSGRTYTGKAAIKAMPSAEFQRRLKEEPDFQNLVELVETGKPLERVSPVQRQPNYAYTTDIVLRGFPMKSGVGASERVELVDLTQEMVDKLPPDAYRQAVVRMTGKPFLSVADAIKNQDGALADMRETYRRIYGR